MNRKNAFFQKHILNSKIPPKQIAHKIFHDMFGFNRMRKTVKESVIQMLIKVVNNQKKFDYNYYLNKNCGMPEDWRSKKVQMLERAKLGGQDRGSVFK